MPTIKKRRADKETQWGRKNSDHCEQLQQHNHESAVEFPGTAANDAVEDVKVGKRASTLKYEQRSGSSQCQLAWNVPGKQQRTESVTDIHLQMMAPADLIEIESRAGLRDNMARHWENGGSAKDCGTKGGERWLPLQNSKERLMCVVQRRMSRDLFLTFFRFYAAGLSSGLHCSETWGKVTSISRGTPIHNSSSRSDSSNCSRVKSRRMRRK